MASSAAPPPRDEARELAQATAQRIMSGFGVGQGEETWEGVQLYLSLPAEVPLADVEADVQSFRSVLKYCRATGREVLCRKVPSGPAIPIDIFDAWPLWGEPKDSKFARYPLPDELPKDVLKKINRIELTSAPSKDAISFFRSRLEDFLTARFSARQSNISKSPGYKIEVHTLQPGERVHYSPAYFQKISTVLGSPTTPVTGWIQPGLYTFSVMKTVGTVFFDPGQYSIPPSTQIHLVV
jgi:hypothetical protein